MTVDIIQFHLPHGRQTDEQCDVDDKCLEAYQSLLNRGCRITAEILQTGHVSLAIEHPEMDYIVKVMPNGPGVKERLEEMILEFKPNDFDEWLRALKEEYEVE